MSPLIRSILASALAFPLTLAAQMSGTYTVDPAGGGNYTTIGAAVTALHTQGISGPVTISIADGTYSETLVVNNITGTSTVNTVTFTSSAANASAVTLAPTTGTQSNNYAAILINQADHVRFSHLTIQCFLNGFYYNGEVNGLVLDHCVLNAPPGVTAHGIDAQPNAVTNDLLIEGCSFTGFFRALSLSGTSVDRSTGTIVRSNSIQSTQVHANGISITSSEDAHIQDNHIDLQAPIPTSLYYSNAISVNSSHGPVSVTGNQVVHGTGGDAISITGNTTTAASPIVLENNMVRLTDGHSVVQAVILSSTGHLRLVNNTIRSEIDKYALSTTLCGEVTLLANILSTVSTKVTYVYAVDTLSSDHNLFHGTGSTVVHTFDLGQLVYLDHDLGSWQATGHDLGSRSGDPLFVSTTDLHIQPTSPAIGLAPYPALIAVDVDGELRPGGTNTFVEAGADELAVCSPMSGTYTISAVGPASFPSLNAAKNALYFCGISGPVTFSIEQGTYVENLRFDAPVVGASSINTVTWRSAANDSSTVIWKPAVGSAPLLNLSEVDHMAFRHLTMDRRNGNGSTLVTVANAGAPVCIGLLFRYVRFIGNAASTAANDLVRCSTGDALATTTFANCSFEAGFYGLNWNGAATEQLNVQDCRFTENLLKSISVNGMRAGLIVERNTFRQIGAGYSAMLSLNACNGSFKLLGNNFRTSGAGFGIGIELTNCAATTGTRAQISNNVIIGWDRTYFNGIQFNGTNNFIDVVHNSVSIKNAYISGSAFLLPAGSAGSNNRVNNNIFHAEGCYPVYNASGAAIGILRNNLLSTTLSDVAFWNGARADIPALQAASGQFAASLEANPLFVNNSSNLHIQSTSPAVAAGHAATSTLIDHDLQTRPLPAATNPDIGADEIDQSAAFAPGVKRLDEVTDTDRVFPNPANEQLTITTDEPRSEHYRLLDLQGRITLEGMLDLPGTLDVTAVAPGTYLLMLGDHTNLTRIIVQH